MFCQDCAQKAVCSSLCPEAEMFISQDEVKSHDLTIGLPRFGKLPPIKRPSTPLSEKQAEILKQIGKGKRKKEICKLLKITPKTYDNQLVLMRKKLHFSG